MENDVGVPDLLDREVHDLVVAERSLVPRQLPVHPLLHTTHKCKNLRVTVFPHWVTRGRSLAYVKNSTIGFNLKS